MQPGSMMKLKVTGTSKKVKWSSNRKKIATVTQKGKVTAKKAGTAVVTAKVGKYRLKCKIKVAKLPSLSKVNALYKAFLSQSTTDESFGGIALSKAYFITVDINCDGVKELVIKERFNPGAMMPCSPIAYIYTIKNNKVVYAGSTSIKQDYSATVQISRKYKAIYSSYPVASYTPEYYYTINNGKLSQVKFFYAQYGYGNSEYGEIPHEPWCTGSGYYIDKKKVTQSKYESTAKRYEDSLECYTLIENTASNRERGLK